ncbi:MAG: M1 family metallopeptidase [candidate division WOR-3 bacterium]
MSLLIFFILLWEQKVNYKMDLELDTLKDILRGYEEITYKNNSPYILKELYLHLYNNAYKNLNTYAYKSFFKDYLISFIRIIGNFFYKDGYIEIDSVKIKNKKVRFKIDETLLLVSLEEDLKPSDSIKFEIYFKSKVPSLFRYRSGYSKNHYDFGQFYPVMCVFDEKGWHNRKWHFNAEFYHNFSNYIVKIKVPGNFIVAGVGECISKNDTVKKDGFKEVIFRAENVIDYFFSCDPDFLYQDTIIDNTHIIAFYRKKNESYKDSFLIRGVRAYNYLKEIFGEYPYKWLKIVDGLIMGGMEYPGLALCGRDTFDLILHEIGHTYFMGILASNQEDEAWLDEGGTSFITDYYKFKKKKNLKIFYENSKNITETIREGFDDILLTASYAFKNNYFSVYSKGSHIYAMLFDIMGEENFEKFLKEYYIRFRFKHPDTDSLFKVAEEIYGKSLKEIKNIYVKGLPLNDYEIVKFKKFKEKDKWLNEIKIKNNGNTIYPISLFLLKGKDTFKTKIDFFKRDTIIKIQTDFEPEKIILDPYNFSLDIKRINNFYPVNFERKLSLNHTPQENGFYLNYFPFLFYSPFSYISPGFNFTFSYLKKYPSLNGEIFYSAKGKDIYYNLKYSISFPFVFPQNIIYLNSLFFESNYFLKIGFKKRYQEYLLDPKKGIFLSEFIYKNSKKESKFFEDANYAGFNFGFYIFPVTDLFYNEITVNFSFYPQRFSGDYNFKKFFIKYELSFSPFYPYLSYINPFDLINIKFFYGRIEGHFPLQEFFNNYSISSYDILSSPFERISLLSSDYTFTGEEGIYLKGYKFVRFKNVLSFSFSSGFKIFGIFYEKILWGDFNLWDSGIYFKKNFKNFMLKIYLPFYINNPELNKEKNNFDFRIKIVLKFFE